ncbi:MAG: DASH family cryptochrome [Cytophagales bacterium]|jgi:deoxyribodipyrimidine photo-lyase|nr:DASH family cryptochrome [Cytophagales bacterium]
MRRILVWFRSDLRIHDHEALATAVRKADEVIPCYCFDPRQFARTGYGFPKTGAFRTQFLVESVENLAAQIRRRGGKLLIAVGHPEEVIPRLAAEHRAEAVYAHKEATDEEVRVEDALEKQLWRQRIPIDYFWGHTLYHADDLPFPLKNLPEIFTDFRKQTERYVQVRAEFPAPEKIRVPALLPDTPVPSVNDFGLPRPVPDERAVLTFVGGETEGLERLKYYLWETDLLRHYKETRNGLLGGDFSSKLAPWLATGCVSPRRIYQEVKRYERERVKNDSTYWLVFELLWRDYFRFVARKHGNALFKAGGIRNAAVQESQLFGSETFERWRNGQTGVPFVDANMVELRQTGFMSNRGRQNVASFLVKDLKADWRAGAAWFESQLLDYDPCSNYGNWNYVAGVGNDPREDRYFNVVKQAHQYDPAGEYVKHWLPALSRIPAPHVHTPYLLPPDELAGYGVRLGEDYSRPLVRLEPRKNEQMSK